MFKYLYIAFITLGIAFPVWAAENSPQDHMKNSKSDVKSSMPLSQIDPRVIEEGQRVIGAISADVEEIAEASAGGKCTPLCGLKVTKHVVNILTTLSAAGLVVVTYQAPENIAALQGLATITMLLKALEQAVDGIKWKVKKPASAPASGPAPAADPAAAALVEATV